MKNLKERFSRRLARVLGSPTPWIFAAGVVALGVVTNGLSALAAEYFAPGDPLRGSLVTVGIGLAVLAAILLLFDLQRALRSWIDRLTRRQPHLEMSSPVPRSRGAVVLVSLGSSGRSAAQSALDYHLDGGNGAAPRLQYAWLLTGPGQGEFSSQANAEALRADYEQRGLKKVEVIALSDADDPRQAFDVVQGIYASLPLLGLAPREVICDYTGGTKSMTSGMVLACASHGYPLAFMKPDRYDAAGHAAGGARSLPRLVNLDFYPERAPSGSPQDGELL